MKYIKPYREGLKLQAEMTAFDLGTSGMKYVRYKRSKNQVSINLIGLDPEVQSVGLEDDVPDIKFPKNLHTRQAVVCVSHPSIVVRMVQVPGSAVQQGSVPRRIQDQLGLKDDVRYSFCMVNSGRGRGDAEFLVAVMPENLVQNILTAFKSGPAPMFLEASVLSALKTFAAQVASTYQDRAVALVESGADSIFLALFSGGKLSLIRTFDFGLEHLFEDIENRFGLGAAQTRAVVSTGNFDVSESITQVLGRFIDQLSLSKDYIERRENARLEDVYISGGLGLSPYVGQAIQNITSFNVQGWNPFEDCLSSPRVLSKKFAGQEARFSAVIGAALNTLGGDE